MAPDTDHPEVVVGGGFFGSPRVPTVEDVKPWIEVLRNHGIIRIDTAGAYPIEELGKSEQLLAESGAVSWYTIDTKVVSTGGVKLHSRENVLKSMEGSLTRLGFSGKDAKGQVDIMYLHAPCLDTPLEETCGAVNEAYQKGWFKRFGVSNYTPWHVEEICAIAEKNGWVKPSVYQGQYNPIARSGEKDLFPVLRKHNIAFFAYSPSGGGIFSGKTTAEFNNIPNGRFNTSTALGQFFTSVYMRPELLGAAEKVHKTAMSHGLNGHEAALRWCLHHSTLREELGDAIIVGAGTYQQLDENLKSCKAGPLPDDLVKVIEEVWKLAEPVAPWAYVEAMPESALDGLDKARTKG